MGHSFAPVYVDDTAHVEFFCSNYIETLKQRTRIGSNGWASTKTSLYPIHLVLLFIKVTARNPKHSLPYWFGTAS